MVRATGLVVGLVAVTAFNGGNVPTDDPTEPQYDDMVPAQYSEFDRTKQARCLGDKLTTKSCWEDDAASVFRYGCMPGDTRVFTDSCGASGGCLDAQCDGQWKWGGEQQATCYDDGENLYEFFCEGDVEAAPEEVEIIAMPVSTGMICSQLGWPLEPGNLAVCGFSKVLAGDCAPDSDFTASAAYCEAVGARLCTANELLADETKGTGCKGDCDAVWSSDVCDLADGSAGHMTAAGAMKCANRFPATCMADSTAGKVRCCADATSTGASAASQYPMGFAAAIAKDYKVSDGNCGRNAPIAEYSCWTNPKDGSSMRFACHDDNEQVFFQTCGFDSTCSTTSCKGAWSETGEMLGQCYTRKAEGYLYEYTCPSKN